MKRKRPQLGFKLDIAAVVQSTDAEAKKEIAKKEEDLKEVENEGPANLQEHCVPIRPIGHGAFGTVSLGVYVPSLTLGCYFLCSNAARSSCNPSLLCYYLVAMKKVSVASRVLEDQAMQELHELHEQLIPVDRFGERMVLFHHHKNIGQVHPCENILSFYGAFVAPGGQSIELITEYMDNGNLEEIINKKGGGIHSEPVLRHIARCCLEGLHHMHSHSTVHLDIKPSNGKLPVLLQS
jgi:serine/threonine protein kinase